MLNMQACFPIKLENFRLHRRLWPLELISRRLSVDLTSIERIFDALLTARNLLSNQANTLDLATYQRVRAIHLARKLSLFEILFRTLLQSYSNSSSLEYDSDFALSDVSFLVNCNTQVGSMTFLSWVHLLVKLRQTQVSTDQNRLIPDRAVRSWPRKNRLIEWRGVICRT